MDSWKDGLLEFYRGKRVLITGHTGFKGTWLTRILLNAGAIVTGYAMDVPTTPALFDMVDITGHPNFTHVIGDIRNFEKFECVFDTAMPEIVFHLAAQPIVRDSYRKPRETYEINMMGTVNVLEAIRTTMDGEGKPVVKSFLNVTTDKVYQNNEWIWGYRENEPLDGFDPYSNSKSCSELVTHSYSSSFFYDRTVRISTARAGNVIGGGDFANDRIIPDAVRAMKKAYEESLKVGKVFLRNPHSIRPYQHVLEPLSVYLLIAKKQYEEVRYAGYYNVGPSENDCITTGELMSLFCNEWNREEEKKSFLMGQGVHSYPKAMWESNMQADALHEANYLKLDCSKIKSVFGWQPCWDIGEAIKKVVRFSKLWIITPHMLSDEMDQEIGEFFCC